MINSCSIYFKSNSRVVRSLNRPIRSDRYRRLNDVFFPIASAGGNVSRQLESRQRSHGDIVRAANPGFQHTAAPYRNPPFTTNSFDLFRFRMTTNTPEFDVDDAAGSKFDRVPRVLRGSNR